LILYVQQLSIPGEKGKNERRTSRTAKRIPFSIIKKYNTGNRELEIPYFIYKE
jgi:hypothetical protein